MSSTTYESPLYAVPDAPPSTKARFAVLLAIGDAARRAFDKARSLPRAAIQWAINLFHRWVETTGSVGVLTWVSAQGRSAARLIRTVGVLPSVLAFLSTPPIAAAAASAARFVGSGIARIATAVWGGIKGLLGRCGTTGTRITEGLVHAGVKVVSWFRAAAQHPVMEPIAQALRATLALVRPVSQGFVAHRLLGALVPILWLRTLIDLLVMPLLVDTSLAGDVRDSVKTPPAEPTSNGNGGSRGTHTTGHFTSASGGTQDGLLIDAVEPPADAPAPTNGNRPTDGATPHEDPPMNRASRRAQQRDDAQARRTRSRR